MGETCYTSIMAVVSPPYTLVTHHPTVHLKRLNAFAPKLYLDKPDFEKMKEPNTELATKRTCEMVAGYSCAVQSLFRGVGGGGKATGAETLPSFGRPRWEPW